MHAGDHDPALAQHDGSERFGSADKPRAHFTRSDPDRILLLDCRRKNYHFDVFRILRPMLGMETESKPLQAIGFE